MRLRKYRQIEFVKDVSYVLCATINVDGDNILEESLEDLVERKHNQQVPREVIVKQLHLRLLEYFEDFVLQINWDAIRISFDTEFDQWTIIPINMYTKLLLDGIIVPYYNWVYDDDKMRDNTVVKIENNLYFFNFAENKYTKMREEFMDPLNLRANYIKHEQKEEQKKFLTPGNNKGFFGVNIHKGNGLHSYNKHQNYRRKH